MSDWSTDPDGFNESVIREFRASGGVVRGELAHMHLLLLTTTDVRCGRRRTTPLAYHRRGELYVVIASNGGATTHPTWFRNLERDPNVTVEVGAESFPATARILDGAERDAVFAAIVARAPAAGAFQENAGRTIPVIELVRLVGVKQAALRTFGELEPPVESRASKLHGPLHTHRTLGQEQVALNGESPGAAISQAL
jgi:deazaflavin-dependent oxidoreductase (nitroreductase family)